MKKIILLLLLMSCVSGANLSIQYIRVIDSTGDNYGQIQVYERTANSERWNRTVKLNDTEPIKKNICVNYTYILEPKQSAILKNPNNPVLYDYVFQHMFFIGFAFSIITILILIFYKTVFKKK